MLLIFPVVFLVVGLGLGGGLFYASYRMRCKLQTIADARPCNAGNPGTGLVKLHGTVKAVNPDEMLTSPIEQRPCVYYRLVIEQFQNSPVKTTGPVRSSVGSGSWVRIIEDVQAIPMVVADETGEVAVDAKEAQLDFRMSRRHANLFKGLPKDLEQSLRDRYKIVTSTYFIAKQMRYSEIVVAEGAEVFVVGDAEEQDGKARLTKKENMLLMTFRREQDVMRNGRVATAICLALAVLFPLGFIALAWFAYSSMSETFGPHQNAPKTVAKNEAKAAGKDDATLAAIAKLKNTGASLSDRAWAARKLADTPVAKNYVADVAPLFNPLLESKDNFHRDSALQAIKQGWGSSVNEPALRRIQQNVKDARVQKDVAAALSSIGG
jgi:hypothetical protein